MQSKVVTDLQDLTYLNWSHVRNSSGTAGTFLKSQSISDGKKVYYKASNFDSENGIVGHECVNEIIVDRLLTILGVEHLSYQLIHAAIDIDGRTFETWICASEDFKESVFPNHLTTNDRAIILEDLEHILSPIHLDKIWEMIYKRWCYYESLCHMG